MFPNSSNPLAACRNKYGPGALPATISKACESKYTDQSIFNYVYHSHALIPGTYNDANRFNLTAAHMVHFVGEPKPWDVSQHGRAAVTGRANASLLWRQRCARARNFGATLMALNATRAMRLSNGTHARHHENATHAQ